MEIEAQGELPPHKHPMAEESYEVLSGEVEVQVDGEAAYSPEGASQ